jgi:hypothetical protein
MDETKKAKDRQEGIEKVGAGGEVGQGQSGVPLHKPQGKRDRELGERERVGNGGPIGEEHFDRS